MSKISIKSIKENDMGAPLRKHRPGCYRVSIDAETFAQIVRCKCTHAFEPLARYIPDSKGRYWLIEYRDINSGQIIRYGGVCDTLKEAAEWIQIR
jgi:hypothetical protein